MCYLLASLGAQNILHVSGIRVKMVDTMCQSEVTNIGYHTIFKKRLKR